MNAELIAALRCEKDCGDCAYYHDNRCDEWGMRCDAADALEADEQRIAELESNNPIVESVLVDKLYQRIGELEAQLPKEGEWIWENYCWHCSVCGDNPTRGMGYVQGKNELFRVCPNCGARMQTVTDCHTLEEGER